jgi:ArsR family transcriptional regulator
MERRPSSDLYRALGHPVRLDILQALLDDGEACVCHLEARFGLRQAFLSQHLGRLRQAGLVADRREGLNVYYRLASPAVRGLLEAGERLEADLRRPAGADRTVRHTRRVAVDGCPCPQCLASKSRRGVAVAVVSARK